MGIYIYIYYMRREKKKTIRKEKKRRERMIERRAMEGNREEEKERKGNSLFLHTLCVERCDQLFLHVHFTLSYSHTQMVLLSPPNGNSFSLFLIINYLFCFW